MVDTRQVRARSMRIRLCSWISSITRYYARHFVNRVICVRRRVRARAKDERYKTVIHMKAECRQTIYLNRRRDSAIMMRLVMNFADESVKTFVEPTHPIIRSFSLRFVCSHCGHCARVWREQYTHFRQYHLCTLISALLKAHRRNQIGQWTPFHAIHVNHTIQSNSFVSICVCVRMQICIDCLRIKRPTNAEWRETKLINWQDRYVGIWLDFLDLHFAKSVVFSVNAPMMLDWCVFGNAFRFFIVSTESEMNPKSMQNLIFTKLWSTFDSIINVFGTHRFCSRIEFDVIGTWLPHHSMDAILIDWIDRNKNEKKVKRNRKFSGLLIIRKHHFRTNINWKVDQGPCISKRLTLTDHSPFFLAFYDVVSPD